MDEGDATAADPVCHLSPMHDQVAAVAAAQQDAPYIYRRIAAKAFSGKVESGFPSENATMQE